VNAEIATEIAKVAAATLGVPDPTVEQIATIAAAVERLLRERISEIGDLRGNVID